MFSSVGLFFIFGVMIVRERSFHLSNILIHPPRPPFIPSPFGCATTAISPSGSLVEEFGYLTYSTLPPYTHPWF